MNHIQNTNNTDQTWEEAIKRILEAFDNCQNSIDRKEDWDKFFNPNYQKTLRKRFAEEEAKQQTQQQAQAQVQVKEQEKVKERQKPSSQFTDPKKEVKSAVVSTLNNLAEYANTVTTSTYDGVADKNFLNLLKSELDKLNLLVEYLSVK